MKDVLRAYIIRRLGPQAPGLDAVLAGFTGREVPRRTDLLREGSICTFCYFLVDGCFQVYRTDGDGKETTLGLVFDGELFTLIDSFRHRTPARTGIRAIDDCRYLTIGYDTFTHFNATIPGFRKVYQQMLEESVAEYLNRIDALLSLDAVGKLKWLQQRYPTILTRLQNKDVAAYLNLSPETLSRAKARLYRS